MSRWLAADTTPIKPTVAQASRGALARATADLAGSDAQVVQGFDVKGVLTSRFSITLRQHKSLHNVIEAIPEDAWTPIPYWMDGAADVAETTYTPFQSEPDAAPVRLIVRRVKPTPGSQLALFATYSYHGFITDRDGEMLELEADHRRPRSRRCDLKGVGLNHMPSGTEPLAVQAMAQPGPLDSPPAWVSRS